MNKLWDGIDIHRIGAKYGSGDVLNDAIKENIENFKTDYIIVILRNSWRLQNTPITIDETCTRVRVAKRGILNGKTT